MRVDRDDSGHTAPFPPSGFVDGLVSEGIGQKAIATILLVANPARPGVGTRGVAAACRHERSHLEVIPKEMTSEVV